MILQRVDSGTRSAPTFSEKPANADLIKKGSNPPHPPKYLMQLLMQLVLFSATYHALNSRLLRGGFTLLNFTALSGVVSGQSSSNTIGFFLASVSSFISSSVKANSLANSIEIFSVFTIIDAPFKTGSISRRYDPDYFRFFVIPYLPGPFGIDHKDNRILTDSTNC